VVTDAEGEIVARGRNRMLEPKASDHDLASTPLAHAEMVALSTMSFGSHREHTLYTSFEPCLMCASTILQMDIGTVAYAASDPLFDGMHDWFGELPFAAARRPARVVLGGPIGSFCHVLHLSWLSFWQTDSPSIDAHGRLSPRQLDAARTITRDGHLAAVAADGGVASDAISAIWDLLPR
jgi:tRNA(Arg) A34 adenosine deaminase TadA